MDGEEEYSSQDMVDIGLDCDLPDKCEGHTISIIITDQFGWKYDVLIDRVSMDELARRRMQIGSAATVSTDVKARAKTESISKPPKEPVDEEDEDDDDDESSSGSSSGSEEEGEDEDNKSIFIYIYL